MLDYQDEIAASYRKSCSDLKEKLKVGLDKINNIENSSEKLILVENYAKELFDPLVIFERKLLRYVRLKQEYQTENKTLQMKIKELELNLESKNVCLMKLKNDIVSHYVQIEFLRKHNEKLESDLENTRRKLKLFEKSQDWLKTHSFPLQINAKAKGNFRSYERYRKLSSENITNNDKHGDKLQNVPDRIQEIGYESENDPSKGMFQTYENEWKRYHSKLIEIFHENIFLKQALQKMRILHLREEKLNSILKSGNEKFSIMKHTISHEGSQSKLNTSGTTENDKDSKILQLNGIIDCMTIKLLQVEFEKRNMELSVFEIREYFMKMKDLNVKLKTLSGHKNHSGAFWETEKGLSWSELNDISQSRKNRVECVQELRTTISNLKFEKLQMEMEHHEDLSDLTDKFGKMQNIMRDIKAVCDNISDDNDVTEESAIGNSGQKITQRNSKQSEIFRFSSTKDCYKQKERERIKHFLRRMESFKEQCGKIVSVCHDNLQLMKKLDVRWLILELRKMKVHAMVKERQSIEQKKRFDKYKKCLLSSIKQYRQSSISKDKQNENLRSIYIPIFKELKLLTYFISENNKYSENPSLMCHENKLEKNVLSNLIQRINNLAGNIQSDMKWGIRNSGTSKSKNHCGGTISTFLSEKMLVDEVNSSEVGEQPLICRLPKPLVEDEDIVEQLVKNICSLRQEIYKSYSIIDQLRREKSLLREDLRQRECLLGKIFNSFKRQLDLVAVDVSEKYFLQRLCNDLRSVMRLYGDQNKVLKEALESNNICTKTLYMQRKISEMPENQKEYIQNLLRKQRDFCEIKETFCDIHSHLETIKKDVSLIQNIFNEDC